MSEADPVQPASERSMAQGQDSANPAAATPNATDQTAAKATAATAEQHKKEDSKAATTARRGPTAGKTEDKSKPSAGATEEVKWTLSDYDELAKLERDLIREWKPESVLEREEIKNIAIYVFCSRRKKGNYEQQIEDALDRFEDHRTRRRRVHHRSLVDKIFNEQTSSQTRKNGRRKDN